ncbi:hypothetical protein HPB52_012591 [Rhipicephalus sanguineus]|uniref:Uncharacterized protein n=1 Tax=Rhipicephalus sanguineus TaxID=34632 RepID=A0A9D4Q9P3_RHISA|nr:hypothetical protein HPB52_012591 [Rhipicephalus sanguineus]
MPEAMVEGEVLNQEEAHSPGWNNARKKRPVSPLQATGKQQCAPASAKYAGALKKVAAASRLPTLPADHCRVVVRPGGGLDVRVVRGVDADLPDSELQRLFVPPHNPMLLGVRRINDTTTVILLFNGLKVPNYVRCGMLLLRCTLYKRQIDTCRVCGRVCDRRDLCPTPTEKTKPTPTQPAQTQPSTSKSMTQTTWADRDTNKGETRGPEQSRQLPQHVTDKIQTLERENAQSANPHPPYPLQIQLLRTQQPRVAPRNAGQLKA